MFGINQISWGQFTRFLVFALLVWYLGILLYGLFKKQGKAKPLFEGDTYDEFESGNPEPIAVSSRDYPAEMIPFGFAEAIPLQLGFYEETGLDEGYVLEHFLNANDPLLISIQEHIQFQQ